MMEKGRWAAGINYPGVGVRYFTSDLVAIEAKAQAESEAKVFGGRLYRYLTPDHSGIHLFVGLEADYVLYDGKFSKGSGYAFEAFAGGEFFFARSLSFQMDAGPAYVTLEDDVSELNVGGIEYVVNFGINYYFGGTK